LKGDAKRREALSKAKKRGAENMDIAPKATKKQRTSKSYSKVGKSSSTSNAAPAATKVRPEPAIKRKDKKDSHRRKSTGSVRFDSSVNKPVSVWFECASSFYVRQTSFHINIFVLTLPYLRRLICLQQHLALPK
jgi:hypothetical protein